jgi:hypothetical protein
MLKKKFSIVAIHVPMSQHQVPILLSLFHGVASCSNVAMHVPVRYNMVWFMFQYMFQRGNNMFICSMLQNIFLSRKARTGSNVSLHVPMGSTTCPNVDTCCTKCSREKQQHEHCVAKHVPLSQN